MIKVLKFYPDFLSEWPFGDDIIMKIDGSITYTTEKEFLSLACQPHDVIYAIKYIDIDSVGDIVEEVKKLGEHRNTTIVDKNLIQIFDKIWEYD